MPDVTLHQFQFSHFNEKARWALAYKDIEHHRISYLPGPHLAKIKKIAPASTTPVITCAEQTYQGSANILEFLEQLQPGPSLHLQDPTVVAWQTKLDEDLGPATRSLTFEALLEHPSYIVKLFGKGKAKPKLWAYRASFGFLSGLIKKANGVNPENLARSRAILEDILTTIAREVRQTGYLVGDRFTAADLTAAALLAPIVNPDHPDMRRPEPIPTELAELSKCYADHSAINWVREMYTRHR